MDNLTSPSSKVVVSTLTALAAMLVMALADNTAILEPLPDWIEAIIAGALVGLAGYFKRENNPAPSSYGQ